MALELADLQFERPDELQATEPAEERDLARDGVRLLVSEHDEHTHARFTDLPAHLEPGDLVVANQSATLPASLPADGPVGEFRLNFSTDYGDGLWLTEPRWSESEPGPLSLSAGDRIEVGGLSGGVVARHPALSRLVFVAFEGDVRAAMERVGSPIRYGYVEKEYPLSVYQTHFAATPGSAEMPSAGRPFTERVVEGLRARGVGIGTITLHTGVSSLEVESDQCAGHCRGLECNPLYAEPFAVSPATATAVTTAKRAGRRVVAVGTTVVRALESAWDEDEKRVRPTSGFTQAFITPERGTNVVDGLLTGLHDPETTHLAMLYAIAGQQTVLDGYDEAIREGYLWHEFGDTHLLLP